MDPALSRVLPRLHFSSMADEADSRWERNTWPEISRLAKEVPEAGIHFRGPSPPFLNSHMTD
jgi:hypothetical protein